MAVLLPHGAFLKGGPSQIHAGNGRAYRSLTARGAEAVDLPLIKVYPYPSEDGDSPVPQGNGPITKCL
jgi:hypothetical protein